MDSNWNPIGDLLTFMWVLVGLALVVGVGIGWLIF